MLGSHRMQSGTHVYDLGSRSRPPEAMDGSDMKPRQGKGVKLVVALINALTDTTQYHTGKVLQLHTHTDIQLTRHCLNEIARARIHLAYICMIPPAIGTDWLCGSAAAL